MASCTFRDYVPLSREHPLLGNINFADYDIYSWAEWCMSHPFVKELWAGWQKLYEEPFRGITANGQVEPNLFHLRDEDIPIVEIQKAAQSLVTIVTTNNPGLVNKMRYPVEANEWRRWQNPEIYFVQCGIRLEEQPTDVVAAVHNLVKCSLSEEGYQKTLQCMRINRFLGDLIDASHLMNEGSYNFILFGEPSLTGPWGWSLWGHHISMCCFSLADQMVISPVFFGCEPNQIDIGEYAGTEIFAREMQLAVRLMKTLSEENRKAAVVYDKLKHPDMPDGFPHPIDGRNLAGAYEDNRVIPYSGVCVSKFSEPDKGVLMELIKSFINFIPEGSLNAKLHDVRTHLDSTWFLWMGKYTDSDPFHFRIHSPVLICEFDHECGMYLTNQEPGRFHIHTVVRTPNGNDYGRELLRLWKAGHS